MITNSFSAPAHEDLDMISSTRVAEVARGHGGRSFGKKSVFLGQNSISWARSALLHGMYCIFD